MAVTKDGLINKLKNGMDPAILDEFLGSTRPQDQEHKAIVAEVREIWSRGEISVTQCYRCGVTGNGSSGFFMSGSLGIVCPDCFDEEEV